MKGNCSRGHHQEQEKVGGDDIIIKYCMRDLRPNQLFF